MGKIKFCPIVGGVCSKEELEIMTKPNTFFLAEPFKPEEERKDRELMVKNALRDVLGEKYSLKFADKEPKDAIFCDICRMIQSCAYGIVDLSGLNSNVLIELGMMLSLGKPVFVLCKEKGKKESRRSASFRYCMEKSSSIQKDN